MSTDPFMEMGMISLLLLEGEADPVWFMEKEAGTGCGTGCGRNWYWLSNRSDDGLNASHPSKLRVH
jgi:hypothetical protein